MHWCNDAELLSAYANEHSEEAFGLLVERYLALVYSAAQRQVQNSHLAEEVTQAVFLILAQKARTLNQRTVLAGWLCRTAHFVARNALKAEFRRQQRETEAHMQSLEHESEAAAWAQLAPLLDEAVSQLNEADRNAVVLRFYERKPLHEVGNVLGIDADAAQKRVARALEKLRKIFSKRGISLTTAIIAAAVSANSVQAAPVGLAMTVAATAAKGAAISSSTLTLIKGALKIMAWTKMKMAVVASVVVLLAAGTTTITIKEYRDHRTYPWEVPNSDSSAFYNAPAQVRIIPTKFGTNIDWGMGDGSRGVIGIGQPFNLVIQDAFQKNKFRTIFDTALPAGRYDYIAKLVGAREPHKDLPSNENWTFELQKVIREKFGVTGKLEMRDTDVLVLKSISTGANGFKVSHSMPNGRAMQSAPGNYSFYEQPMSTLADRLEWNFQIPIIDQTGLKENYDYILKWSEPDISQPNLEGLKQALHNQLGLELVPTNMPIEMLVVEKVK